MNYSEQNRIDGKFPFYSTQKDELFELIATKEVIFGLKWDRTSENCKSFVRGLLEKNPEKRMSAKQALEHPWIKNADDLKEAKNGPQIPGII